MKDTRVAPSWPFAGADVVYSRAYRLLEKWGRDNWQAQLKRYKLRPGRKLPPCPAPTEDMNALIEALGLGDEETIKGVVTDAVIRREIQL